jgi:GlcNAc-P-P-Und epimerase
MNIFLTGGSGFIGTHLVEAFLKRGDTVTNFDRTAPRDTTQESYWTQGDILDGDALREAMEASAPDIVLHVAARTDCDENTTVEKDYRVNTEGTTNFLAAVKASPSVKRALIVSSQYVAGPSRLPESDTDYFPHTVYGQSKVITEKLTREANLACCWTLVRPTNVWGAWHVRYPTEFWRIAAKGLYFHPGGVPVRRCYGYVGNVVWQILRALELPEDQVNGKTFYVSDEVTDIFDWASGFCKALCGRPAPKIPRPLLRLIALAGDAISLGTGKPFYLTSSRYRSMTSDYPVPMEKTFAELGRGPYSLEEGIAETVQWLLVHGGPDFQSRT